MATAQGLRYRIAKSKVRVPLVWYRHRALSPGDVFVGAYPRSGSTWLRFLLLEVLSGQCAEFDSVNTLLPSVGEHRGSPALLPGGGRLIKTHENYRPEYRKAVYLVRDARDVLLSEYAYQKAKGWFESDFDSYLLAFLKGKVNAYGSWQEHVRDWTDAARHGRCARESLSVYRRRGGSRTTAKSRGQQLPRAHEGQGRQVQAVAPGPFRAQRFGARMGRQANGS